MKIERERFHPGGFTPPWVRHQHLERYRWAAKSVAGMRVLDVACGTGYGTAMLARAGATRVNGFDCSPDTVAFAERSWPLPNVRFGVANADRLPVPDASYDIYVSFETIEHVEDDHALLTEAARVLSPGGLLLVSTPNRELLDPGTSIEDKPANRFHTREYRGDEIADRLRGHFASIDWYGQSPFSPHYIARLSRLGRHWPALAVRLHQLRKTLGWPWESPQRHFPARCSCEPAVVEILIAACRSGTPSDDDVSRTGLTADHLGEAAFAEAADDRRGL